MGTRRCEWFDREIARAPQDMDLPRGVLRVLAWSGRPLRRKKSAGKPEVFVTIRTTDGSLRVVYSREGTQKRRWRAPRRCPWSLPLNGDLHAARARGRACHRKRSASSHPNFQKALDSGSPSTTKRHTGILSTRNQPDHALRFGACNYIFNFAGGQSHGAVSLYRGGQPHGPRASRQALMNAA